jgi:hypothetical protein
MAAAAIRADVAPPVAVWQSLQWIAPATLLWILLIYWQPALSDSGAPSATARLILMASSASACGWASNAPIFRHRNGARAG